LAKNLEPVAAFADQFSVGLLWPMNQLALDLSREFPILEEVTFLNHAGVAPLSARAAAALRDYADHAAARGYVGSGWHKRIKQIKESAAQLIHAAGGHEIAFIPNTSTGLAQVAEGVGLKPGDNVVITNVEYPANRYPWQNLTARGIELREVAQQPDGRIDVEDVCGAINDRTKVVSISHVQYASGHRIDPRPIAETVHQAGGYLCLDAIQSVGLMPVDVQAWGVDFLAADGHKWMLGPEGAGFMYCRADLIAHVQPVVVGWMNMVDAHNFGNYRFEFRDDARRFEPGTYNVPGILSLGASIDLLLEIGLDTVWQRVEALTARLCEGLERKGYRIFSPRDAAAERSAIVIFEPTDAQGELDLDRLVADLARQDIHIVTRNGRLRASPHFYNTPEQMDALIEALP
jgi:selenocysteine lyase/cysteine desulfurase